MKTAFVIVALAICAGILFFARRAMRNTATRDVSGHSSGLFSMEDKHLAVHSADNLRLLSDEQLAHLERDTEAE